MSLCRILQEEHQISQFFQEWTAGLPKEKALSFRLLQGMGYTEKLQQIILSLKGRDLTNHFSFFHNGSLMIETHISHVTPKGFSCAPNSVRLVFCANPLNLRLSLGFHLLARLSYLRRLARLRWSSPSPLAHRLHHIVVSSAKLMVPSIVYLCSEDNKKPAKGSSAKLNTLLVLPECSLMHQQVHRK